MSCMYCDFPNANSLRLNHHWLGFMLLAYARSIYIKLAIKALRGKTIDHHDISGEFTVHHIVESGDAVRCKVAWYLWRWKVQRQRLGDG